MSAPDRAPFPGRLTLFLLVLALGFGTLTFESAVVTTASAAASERPLPLLFTRDGANLVTHMPGGTLVAAARSLTLHLATAAGSEGPAALTIHYPGANVASGLRPIEPLATAMSHYAGSRPDEWREGLATYAAVQYPSLYPGVSLVVDGRRGLLKGTYEVAPGTDPAAIRWQYEGASSLMVEPASGDLRILLPDGRWVTEPRPIAWQESDGRRVMVPAAYTLAADGSAGFRLGRYDPDRPLTIDPTLIYEQTIDAPAFGHGRAIVADSAGNAYVLADAFGAGNDLLLIRLAPDGSVVYATLIGGTEIEDSGGIVLGADGILTLTGRTLSPDFPLLNPFQPARNGFSDSFLMRVQAESGSLVQSSYLGGSRAERGGGVALAADGSIMVTGSTDSTDFPVTPDAYQAQLNLTGCFCFDAFLARLAPDGSEIQYATYLGGARDDLARGVGMDAAGNSYLTGVTLSTDFPTSGPLQPDLGGAQDAFVARLSADGQNLDYATYLGGLKVDVVQGIRVAPDGAVTVAGYTGSADFPTTAAAFQPLFAGGVLDCGSPPFDPLRNCYDAFVTRIAPDGSAYEFSTHLGGGRDDEGGALAISAAGESYLTGWSSSTDFPGLPNQPPRFLFVSKLSADGAALEYSEPLYTNDSSGHGLTLDPHGAIYLTAATNVPSDVYVAKLAEGVLVRSAQIALQSRPVGPYFLVAGLIVVRDSAGLPVPGAQVVATWSNPAGGSRSRTVASNANGLARLFTAGGPGSYRLQVETISAPGYTFDPASGILERTIVTGSGGERAESATDQNR